MQNVISRWDEIKENTNINLDLFLEMTEFCINCSYFQFKGQSYQQVFGTAMGNPLSPIIADLVMETLLDSVTKTIKFPIPVIKKHVDDLMLAIPKDEIETVKNTFNQYHQKIQFTVEVEKDGKLPYLDLLLVRKPDQTIKTEWYAKPIASGRFLNYLSAHSMTLKINVAKNLIKRVTTFSTNVDEATAKKIIHTQLRQNDYPKPLINRLINRRRENPPAAAPPTEDDNTKTFRSIVNIGSLTHKIQRTLRSDYPEVVTCPQQRKTVRSIIPGVKDKLEENQRSNVIYKIPCADCGSSYVGMTSCRLKDRVSGHRSTINKLTELREAGKDETDQEIMRLREKTALLDHCITNNHQFLLDRVEVLDSSHKKQNLAILESCHILNTQHTVNKRTDTDNLSGTYAGVLHTVKTIQHTTHRRTVE
ncbi:uncharacterized protein LOC134286739 [Aedes albopictus]|uniref:Reverse transcriptase domain-containing protein n=2 Tax=Aedes albopictus TaxID=7160 RepID=A0ABM1ZDD6_AEDAL